MNKISSVSRTEKYIPVKEELLGIELLKAGPAGVSKLAMLEAYGETCLNTTISHLGLNRGINIARERRPHRHQNGGDTYFTWYWLPSRREAKKVLDMIWEFRKTRGETLKVGDYWQLFWLLDNFPE
ncbi:hypothetical protein [Amphritea sp. HPY]|uniref:hypothetical protein n=1 Tax=Amphritea sp. HPY TaxID=3421652 RepID=UPI003D7E4F20